MNSGKGGTVAAVLGVLVIIACIVAGFYFGGKTVFTKKNAESIERSMKTRGYMSGEWVYGEVEGCSTEFYEIKHKLNGIIPTGKEHFFCGYLSDGQIVVIRATKKWYEKNFDEETWLPKNGDAVKLEGYVRKIDTKFVREIQEITGTKLSYGTRPTYYVDTIAMRYGIFLMILAGFPILLVIVIFLVNKTELLRVNLDSTPGKIFMIAGIVLFFAYAGLMMHTLAMI